MPLYIWWSKSLLLLLCGSRCGIITLFGWGNWRSDLGSTQICNPRPTLIRRLDGKMCLRFGALLGVYIRVHLELLTTGLTLSLASEGEFGVFSGISTPPNPGELGFSLRMIHFLWVPTEKRERRREDDRLGFHCSSFINSISTNFRYENKAFSICMKLFCLKPMYFCDSKPIFLCRKPFF